MDIVTKARINLFAVLRNVQELCSLDKESAELIKDEKLSVGFNVAGVGNAVMSFKDGKCTFSPKKGGATLQLYFKSAEHFNKLIDGEKTIPIFYNVFKVGFLLNKFTKLADRLSYYLQPSDPSLLKDPEFFTISTTLTAYTAFYALCEVGNSDPIGRVTAARIEDGVINCFIKDGPALNITVDKGHMTAAMGISENWKASMEFASMEFASEVLNGTMDTFTGMGTGLFALKGRVPMLENLAKLLAQVAFYLR